MEMRFIPFASAEVDPPDDTLLNVWSAARLQGKSWWMKESLRQCIRPVCGGSVLLAMMRYAAYLSYKIPRLGESHLRNQVSGTPFDCSFIFTSPVQTSVGELDLEGYESARR